MASIVDLAMINTGAVQGNERHAGAMLDVMDQDFVDPAFHTDTLIHANNANRAGNSRLRIMICLQRPDGNLLMLFLRHPAGAAVESLTTSLVASST